MYDWIIWTAGLFTAITVITTGVIKVVKYVWKMFQKINKIADHAEETYLDCKKLTIMSSDMPYGERVIAAQKYLEAGGNGDVKKFCIEHLGVNRVEGENGK